MFDMNYDPSAICDIQAYLSAVITCLYLSYIYIYIYIYIQWYNR